MMSRIYKYVLYEDGQRIQMPETALILSCQLQNKLVTIWAKVNPEEKERERRFAIVMTGEERDLTNHEFIATIQTNANVFGAIVMHVFQIR